MKTEQNILMAFILNLSFSVFEFFGGIITGSVAIISDAVHDIGDAVSIGISYFLEKKSKKQPDDLYTYGYCRYSAFGGMITTLVLLISAVIVTLNAIHKIFSPNDINYNGMIIFAVIGVCVNLSAAFFTRHGDSLNQKAVNLHMFEDVMGWVIVLIGAFVIRFTGFTLIDPIMSIGVSLFILINSTKNLKEIIDLFLEKAPHDIHLETIRKHILGIDGVLDVHHIHVWSLDEQNHLATMHIISDTDAHQIKNAVRKELQTHNIKHITIEIESSVEHCHAKHCHIDTIAASPCVHHHHHHHK